MKSFLKVVKGAVAVGAVSAAMVFGSNAANAEPVVASYYGWALAGNPTASGEIFDPTAMTAAHPSLPFGTQLEVCYQSCVTVTVNDRGPFVGGRGLDLSEGAAQAIGLTGVGVDTVDMTVVSEGDGATTAATDTTYSDPYATTYSDPYATGYTGYYYDPYSGTYVYY